MKYYVVILYSLWNNVKNVCNINKELDVKLFIQNDN